MKHQDGIEVYLKPVGDNHIGSRYHEHAPATMVSNAFDKTCTIFLKRHTCFLVVVRFRDDFEMHGAAAVRIKVKFGIGQLGFDRGAVDHMIVRASSVPASQHVLHELRMLDFEDGEDGATVPLSMQPCNGML
jgi:hypothetical protein